MGERFGLVRSICAFVARFESINTFQIVLTASPEWVCSKVPVVIGCASTRRASPAQRPGFTLMR